jgi:hypothetical protein
MIPSRLVLDRASFEQVAVGWRGKSHDPWRSFGLKFNHVPAVSAGGVFYSAPH